MLEKKYESKSDTIASYSYTDLASGTGVVAYQGFRTVISGSSALPFQLTTSSIYSADIETDSIGTYNFDLTAFNYPQTIKGTATIRFSAQFNQDVYGYFAVTFQKVAASGSVSSLNTAVKTLYDGSAAAAVNRNFVLYAALTETLFGVGDKLRVQIIQYGGGGIYLGHDPANRNGAKITPASTYPTKLEVFIPYKIDV